MTDMRDVPRKHTNLWNDLPDEERDRLMPHQIETQILHIEQVRAVLVTNHKKTLAQLDKWISNCRNALPE